jgi:hypothetical protein
LTLSSIVDMRATSPTREATALPAAESTRLAIAPPCTVPMAFMWTRGSTSIATMALPLSLSSSLMPRTLG